MVTRSLLVRKSAIEALGEVGGPSACTTLIDKTVKGENEEQLAAVRALGRLGDEAAVTVLAEIGLSGNEPLKAEAAKALESIAKAKKGQPAPPISVMAETISRN